MTQVKSWYSTHSGMCLSNPWNSQALLRLIPKFPLFPATVDDKALENSSQEPEAQSSLILSLIREPFLKLKHTNIPYAFPKTFGSRFLKQFVVLLHIGVYCIS